MTESEPTPSNAVLTGFGTTVFEAISRRAVERHALNLGQGFPDDGGPPDVVDAAAQALQKASNQYPPMMGLPALRRAVADHAARFYGLTVDWQSEVMVTCGATEGLAACFLGLLNPGDEVVLFEPMYDSYRPMIRLAGATSRCVTLTPPDWRVTADALAAVLSPHTKLIVLNSPLNPVAKLFDDDELHLIADAISARNCLVVCDEVYEHIVFDGRRHRPLMTLPGMRTRCLRLGSAGKTFSLTGWKVGYVTAAADVLAPVVKAHQFLTFTTAPNLQAAVAHGLAKDDDYFAGLAQHLQAKRDRFCAGLAAAKLQPLPVQGTYFVVADVAAHLREGEDDAAFCHRLIDDARVAAIPVSAFYASDAAPRSLIRFCFAKRDDVLDAAADRLHAYLARA